MADLRLPVHLHEAEFRGIGAENGGTMPTCLSDSLVAFLVVVIQGMTGLMPKDSRGKRRPTYRRRSRRTDKPVVRATRDRATGTVRRPNDAIDQECGPRRQCPGVGQPAGDGELLGLGPGFWR